mgnify:CR=1 FL=1
MVPQNSNSEFTTLDITLDKHLIIDIERFLQSLFDGFRASTMNTPIALPSVPGFTTTFSPIDEMTCWISTLSPLLTVKDGGVGIPSRS